MKNQNTTAQENNTNVTDFPCYTATDLVDIIGDRRAFGVTFNVNLHTFIIECSNENQAVTVKSLFDTVIDYAKTAYADGFEYDLTAFTFKHQDGCGCMVTDKLDNYVVSQCRNLTGTQAEIVCDVAKTLCENLNEV